MNVEEPQNLKDCNLNPQSEKLRDELIRLSAAKEIKYSEKYIKKASQPALEKIKHDHQRDQMDKVNSLLTENLITKFSDLLEQLNIIKKDGTLDDELSSNKLFYDDVKTVVMKISPYIPMVGLLSGGLVVAKHVWSKTNDKDEPKISSNQDSIPSDDSSSSTNPGDDRVNTS